MVCAGIHMSPIPSFPYEALWEERVLRSVANLTRRDGEEFLDLAARVPVRTQVQAFPLADANEALQAVREGTIRGSAVLRVGGPVGGRRLVAPSQTRSFRPFTPSWLAQWAQQ